MFTFCNPQVIYLEVCLYIMWLVKIVIVAPFPPNYYCWYDCVAVHNPRWCHMLFGKLLYIQLLIASVWLCTPPVVSHVSVLTKFLSSPTWLQYGSTPPFPPSAVVTRVLSDKYLLEAPGAFSLATYTPRWCVHEGPPVASVYLCASLRCRTCFLGIIFVFRQPQ